MSLAHEMPYRTNCPTCQGERNCFIKGHVETGWTDQDDYVQGGTEHRLIQCHGCDTVFYESKSWCSENVEHYVDAYGNDQMHMRYQVETYPHIPTRRPGWLSEIPHKDEQLSAILDEVYTAIDNHSYILASIGLRTAFDKTSEYLKISPDFSLGKKVNELFKQGYIGETERDQLLIVTDAGNAAAHRGWSPTSKEFNSLLNVTENFISRTVLKNSTVDTIKDKIPQRAKP